MNLMIPFVLSALKRTIKQETYEFEHFLTAREDNEISMVTRGYVDFAAPLVAAEMIMDVVPESESADDVVRMWTFLFRKTIYQRASVDQDEWVSLDSHGIGASPLAVLYWLYGLREVTETDRAGRYKFILDFERACRTAPEAEAESLRKGLHETRTDLLGASADGYLDITEAGIISYLEIVLPAYEGPNLALNQPQSLVTLALTPTMRRSVELPETDVPMNADAFMKELLGNEHLDG